MTMVARHIAYIYLFAHMCLSTSTLAIKSNIFSSSQWITLKHNANNNFLLNDNISSIAFEWSGHMPTRQRIFQILLFLSFFPPLSLYFIYYVCCYFHSICVHWVSCIHHDLRQMSYAWIQLNASIVECVSWLSLHRAPVVYAINAVKT